MHLGIAPRSFVHDSLLALEHEEVGKSKEYMCKVIAGTAASLYSAATDTTNATLLTAFRLLQLHPDVQNTAFEEIRSVIGLHRLPILSDAPSLPFLDAIVKEVHRFNPAVPLMPRSPDKDDVFDGWKIPGKSWMFNNLWAMTHDEEEYADPFKFDPWRYIRNGSKDPRNITFGFGRRRCPGAILANATAFLMLARIIAAFTLESVEDDGEAKGSDQIEFSTGFTSAPVSFKCRFVPRSDIAVTVERGGETFL